MSTKGCGHWDKRAGRRFRTGIDLGLLSGAGIKQNNKRFMACTLHVPSIDCSKAGVMDSVVSNSSPGFPSPYEVCSVLNHRLYTKVLNAFPGCCGHCLLYRIKILKQIDMWNTFITRARREPDEMASQTASDDVLSHVTAVLRKARSLSLKYSTPGA